MIYTYYNYVFLNDLNFYENIFIKIVDTTCKINIRVSDYIDGQTKFYDSNKFHYKSMPGMFYNVYF